VRWRGSSTPCWSTRMCWAASFPSWRWVVDTVHSWVRHLSGCVFVRRGDGDAGWRCRIPGCMRAAVAAFSHC
jgi:hypothetical protein